MGPQVAEKLDLPQITYAETIESLHDGEVVVRRALALGTETVRCSVPCLLTVVGSANQPRPPSVRRMLANKLASTPLEYSDLLAKWPEFETKEALDRYLSERGQVITVWDGADVGVDYDRVGLAGSPTKVLLAVPSCRTCAAAFSMRGSVLSGSTIRWRFPLTFVLIFSRVCNVSSFISSREHSPKPRGAFSSKLQRPPAAPKPKHPRPGPPRP